MSLLCVILVCIIMILGLLVSIAFMTLVERKLISIIQNRKGPNVIGWHGLLQPLADALKLIIKESIFPRNARFIVFLIAPIISFFFALLAWAFVPFNGYTILVDTNLALFFIFACSVLHIYGVILAGWSSGSKYSFLGAVRSSAQLIAYDISIGLTISCLVFYVQSMSLIDYVNFQADNGWLIFYLPLLFVVFFVSSLAETNRHPFDLPEAESELVGGYTTEYSSSFFALFFLGEYCSILLMVFLITHLFLGGWGAPTKIGFFLYFLKLLVVYYTFIIIRAAIPRYRYDQLMRLGWKFVIPISLSYFFIIMFSVFVQNYMDPAISFVKEFPWFALLKWFLRIHKIYI